MKKCHMYLMFSLLGKKWTIFLIELIALHGENGFNSIFKRMKKVTPKLLAKRLIELESLGLLKKSISVDKKSIRTSYSLSEKGTELYQIVKNIKFWNNKYSGNNWDCSQKECVDCPFY